MNRMIRAATVAALLTSGLGSVGCVHTRGDGGGADLGGCYRNAVDPCYPERYQHAARQAVIGPFAQQVHNGYVMNQTIYNYYFEPGTDKLTPAGLEKLDSLARVRPAADPKLYIQTARDILATPENADKVATMRDELNVKRAQAIIKYMNTQPSLIATAYEVFVHDPVVPGINAEFAASAYRGSARGYAGSISGAAGIGALGTGGGGGNLFIVPAPAAGGGPGGAAPGGPGGPGGGTTGGGGSGY